MKISKRRVAIALVLAFVAFALFVYWRDAQHRLPPLRPVHLYVGHLGDLSRRGFIVIPRLENDIIRYNWDGIAQWRETLPEATDISTQDCWFSPDYVRSLASDPFTHEGNRTLYAAGHLMRFSPAGAYLGVLTYQGDHLIISVFQSDKLLWRRSLSWSAPPIAREKIVDLLIDDAGLCILYAPHLLNPGDDYYRFNYIPLAVVTRDHCTTRNLATCYKQTVAAYVAAVRPNDGLPDQVTWKMPIRWATTSPFKRYAFTVDILQQLPGEHHHTYLTDLFNQGTMCLTVYQYPGKCIAQLTASGKSPGDNSQFADVNFRDDCTAMCIEDSQGAYFAPDGKHLIIDKRDDCQVGLFRFR